VAPAPRVEVEAEAERESEEGVDILCERVGYVFFERILLVFSLFLKLKECY